MILIAASAVALVIVRPVVAGPLQQRPGWSHYLAWAIGWLVAWTPTVLILRLRDPRPPLRRLSRQPGFAASLAGTAVLALGLLAIGLIALVRVARQGSPARPAMGIRPPDPSWWVWVVLHFGTVVGPAVIAAWVLLAVSGRRRPPRGWLDILARAVGVGWIVLFVINCCARLTYLRN